MPVVWEVVTTGTWVTFGKKETGNKLPLKIPPTRILKINGHV